MQTFRPSKCLKSLADADPATIPTQEIGVGDEPVLPTEEEIASKIK